MHVCICCLSRGHSPLLDALQVSQDSYEAMVAGPNINREADEASARNVEEAVSLLSVNDSTTPEDRHPERYGTAAATKQ